MNISSPLPPLPGWPLWRWIVESRFRPRAAARRPVAIAEDDLADLDARTLRDIGASPRLLACAQARHDARRDERAALRLGVASASWRHW